LFAPARKCDLGRIGLCPLLIYFHFNFRFFRYHHFDVIFLIFSYFHQLVSG
jgi:hypothetical protein